MEKKIEIQHFHHLVQSCDIKTTKNSVIEIRNWYSPTGACTVQVMHKIKVGDCFVDTNRGFSIKGEMSSIQIEDLDMVTEHINNHAKTLKEDSKDEGEQLRLEFDTSS